MICILDRKNMKGSSRLMAAIAVLIILYTPGCLHRRMGVGSESGFEVARRIATGMTRTEVLEVLGSHGTTSISKDLLRPEGSDWVYGVDETERAALSRIKDENGVRVSRYVIVDRAWGMIGLDQYILYFSKDDRLLDFIHGHLD